jgi:hypothetical protein
MLPWMMAEIVVVDTPLYALTDANGAFRIDGVPPGEYKVEVRHECAKLVRSKVTARAGERAALELVLAAPAVRVTDAGR